MADFPSKVTTETSSPHSQSSQQGGNSLRGLSANIATMMNMSFIRSIPAILMMVEIFMGLLQWALIADAPYRFFPVYSWVMAVAVTLWLLTSILFVIILFGFREKLTSVPWTVTVMGYNVVATVLYLSAFLANAANVRQFRNSIYFGQMAAAAFFGAVVTLAYAASSYFSYLVWKGDGGNAATDTVPA